jgi:GNAT superfamily N-acetyltransferase
MHIERLTRSSTAQYRDLMLQAHAHESDAFISTLAERTLLPTEWWETRIADTHGSSITFGAFAEDILIGSAGIRFEARERERHKATLFGMYVLPQHRGGGVGRGLVQAVLDCAKEREHIAAIQLALIEGNFSAQRLYESCGFETYAIEPMALRMETGDRALIHLWQRLR